MGPGPVAVRGDAARAGGGPHRPQPIHVQRPHQRPHVQRLPRHGHNKVQGDEGCKIMTLLL